MRIGQESYPSLFEDSDGYVAGYRRELLHEDLERITFLKIVEEVLNWHARARKDGSTALDFRVNDDQRLFHFLLQRRRKAISLPRAALIGV